MPKYKGFYVPPMKKKTRKDFCKEARDINNCKSNQCDNCLFGYYTKRNLEAFNQWKKENEF